MRLFKQIIILFILLWQVTNVISQKRYEIKVKSQINISSNDNLLPHYQYSNKWGVVDPFEPTQGLLLMGGKYNLVGTKNFKFEIGTSVVVKDKTDDSFLHEVYMNGRVFKFIDINIGKHAYSPVSYDDQLTIGGFMRNANARPIPRAQIGIFNYQPVGFLKNKVSIRGGLSHGILNDDRTATEMPRSADDVHLHEKWAYFKIETNIFQPYAGLFHTALMGGERADGLKIKKDYWATFLGGGSNKVGGWEATNAAGAHEGFWDFGVYHENNFCNIHMYLQKPFADGSGLNIYKRRNHDFKFGVLSDIKKGSLIKKISFEFFKTDHQSGPGFTDPLHPDPNITYIFPREVENYDAFMNDVFGIKTNGYTYEDFARFLREEINQGHSFGGRDNYNNNGMYYNGWTYFGMPMGNPIYHTVGLAKAYAPDWEANNFYAIVNNRIKGFSLGLMGDVCAELSYVIKTTYTLNRGSYMEEYKWAYSWDKDEENFYAGGKREFYSDLSLQYQNDKWKNLSIQSSFSYDAGELYHAFGCMFGLAYCIN